jgi:predicted enzyme related to lactoylglutathione lyase
MNTGASKLEVFIMQGLGTVIYQVSDLKAATAWYTQVVGHPPYFDQPFYVGFDVGGYELGLQDDAPASAPQANVVAYWRCTDAATEVARILALGATLHAALADVGEGIKVATLRDP